MDLCRWFKNGFLNSAVYGSTAQLYKNYAILFGGKYTSSENFKQLSIFNLGGTLSHESDIKSLGP